MPIEIKKDGRTIRTGRDYTEFRKTLYERQNGLCCECERETYLDDPIEWTTSFHVAHIGSRGMGAGMRDDVLGEKRGQVRGGKCGKCHRREHRQGL